jgi:fructokinase
MTTSIIVGIGEILFDILGNSEELGGAPANFAYHVNTLGAQGFVISAIGDDSRGLTALEELRKRRLSTDFITILKGGQTGYVRATLNDSGIATYKFPNDIAWDHLQLNRQTEEIASNISAVCFGSLAQRNHESRKEIYRFLDLTPRSALKVFDLNLRQSFYTLDIIQQSLSYADILKLNDEELPILAQLLGLTGDHKAILTALVKNHDLQLAMLTRGNNGSLLVSHSDFSDHPGIPIKEIVDTIGAGDAFTASTIVSLLNGDNLETINKKANTVAAQVCSYKGAMPVFDE